MAASLLLKAHEPGDEGLTVEATRAAAGWDYVEFGAHRLRAGEGFERAADDQERAVVVLEGRARVGAGARTFDDVGSRDTVFDGPPAPIVLVAPGTPLSVEAGGGAGATILIASAPGTDVRLSRLIEPSEIFVESRGSGDTLRTIHHLLPPAAEAGRIILFEVYTPGGNWSSYPPHKHDVDNPPVESYLEELYYYRFARPKGYALQRVYTADRTLDETVAPTDGDVVLVPRGYHTVGAPAGYDCYYLNAMAGPTRRWQFTVDPDHAWLMDWNPAQPTSRG